MNTQGLLSMWIFRAGISYANRPVILSDHHKNITGTALAVGGKVEKLQPVVESSLCTWWIYFYSTINNF